MPGVLSCFNPDSAHPRSNSWVLPDLCCCPQVDGTTVLSKFGTFVASTHEFDAAAFGLPAQEAALMDPQQRLLLEESLTAFHGSGYTPAQLLGSKTGVFVGW
jgi:acyl transferase domain-containing protein